MTDGQSSVSSSILQEAKDAYITIYTIGLGNSSDSVLENIANETGGEFFKAYTADELQAIYAQIGLQPDYDKTDTDGDGLLDGEEINPTLRYCKQDFGAFAMSGVTAYYFSINSDPRYKDSDGDSYLDYDEVKTYKSNPYKNEVSLYRWDKGYINVDYAGNENWKSNDKTMVSYGGNQGWFYKKEDEKWYTKFRNDYVIENNGCGLISASVILLYLSLSDNKFNTKSTKKVKINSTGNINYNTYVDYIYHMDSYYFTLYYTGIFAPNMALQISHYGSDYHVGLEAKWCVSKKKLLSRIKKMLNNNIPIPFLIGSSGDKSGVNFYDLGQKDKDPYNFVVLSYPYLVDNHYVTITGMLEDKVKIKLFWKFRRGVINITLNTRNMLNMLKNIVVSF